MLKTTYNETGVHYNEFLPYDGQFSRGVALVRERIAAAIANRARTAATMTRRER